MRITGTYSNYQYLSHILSPLSSGKVPEDFVSQTFLSALTTLRNKTDIQLFSKNSAAALLQLYSSSSDLAHQAAKLTPNDPSSVFNDRTAISSDTKVLTASAYSALSSKTGAAEATYSIDVASLAQAQQNIGSEFMATDPGIVGTGTHSFDIAINGVTYQISIDVETGDTNEAVFQKMAAAINTLGIGIIATVDPGTTAGTHRLAIEANATGAANAFTISDVTGNAVATTGVGAVSLAAQDASYAVDGISYTSSSNTTLLDNGMVTVNLKGPGSADLTVAPDKTKVLSAVSGLISGINGFVNSLIKNSTYIKDGVLSAINLYISDHKIALETIGIAQGADGKLTVDSVKFTTAVSQNMTGIKSALAGLDGLAIQMKNCASRITADSPINYAKEAGVANADFVGYLSGNSSAMYEQILLGSLYNIYI